MYNQDPELLTGLEDAVTPEPLFEPSRSTRKRRQPDADARTNDDWGAGAGESPIYVPGRPPIVPRASR